MALAQCAFLLACNVPVQAAATEEVRSEIQFLLQTIAQSNCEFQRNGSWHAAADASAHLKRKFEYLNKRNLADTVPLFIERAGTRSSMSGKTYTVRCANTPEQASADWLMQMWMSKRANTLPR